VAIHPTLGAWLPVACGWSEPEYCDGSDQRTPNASGTSNFTVRVTDANNASVDRALALTVASAPPALLGLTISTDNANEVYLNGVLLGTANDWTRSSNYSAALQSGTNVLASKALMQAV